MKDSEPNFKGFPRALQVPANPLRVAFAPIPKTTRTARVVVSEPAYPPYPLLAVYRHDKGTVTATPATTLGQACDNPRSD